MTNFKAVKFEDKQKRISLFGELCKSCGLCIAKCPTKAIKFSSTKVGHLSTPVVDVTIEKCIACGLCELFCPDCALKVDKKKKKS